jgi:hypothetical protein
MYVLPVIQIAMLILKNTTASPQNNFVQMDVRVYVLSLRMLQDNVNSVLPYIQGATVFKHVC